MTSAEGRPSFWLGVGMLALLALCILFSDELLYAYMRPADWWHHNLPMLQTVQTVGMLAPLGFVLLTIMACKLKWRVDLIAYAYKAGGILVVMGTWIGYLLYDRLHKLLVTLPELGILHVIAGTVAGLFMIIFGIFLERKAREFE